MFQLKCSNLTLGYDSRTIIENLSFEIEAGSYVCIIGENGSGKSTLMKTLLGLHKPVSGKIETGDGIAQNEIGYLPQQTDVQKDFPASVREIVISGCLARMGLRPFYNKKEKLLAARTMAKLGITNLAKRCYRELSGGQQQRVLLARALCATQKMLFLDEPVTGLDPSVTEEMYRLIEELNEDGITIVMISHDIDAAMKHATHILHIDSKNHAFYGTKEEFVNSANCKDCADKIRKYYVKPNLRIL
ncbi:MAG: ABC transporter ATP-binding protein [Treponema sp.]|nr:ABC transporter ATP-binding protein [Treponema sp.]